MLVLWLVYGLVVSPAIHSDSAGFGPSLGVPLICFLFLGDFCSDSILFQFGPNLRSNRRSASLHTSPCQVPSGPPIAPLPRSVCLPPAYQIGPARSKFAWARCILLNLLRCRKSAGVPPDPTSLGTAFSQSQCPSGRYLLPATLAASALLAPAAWVILA